MASFTARMGMRRWLPARPGDVAHIGFGTFCHIAAALRDCGLRGWTGPFDWIFSTPAMLGDCLDDDFAALLDPRHLESVAPGALTNGAKRQCRHRLYQERYGLPTLFNHHDPAGVSQDRNALERAVARMRAALGGPGANVLYMMSETFWPEPELAALAARLGALPSRNTLAVIALDGRGHPRSWSMEPPAERSDGIVHVSLMTGSRSRGAAFVDPADDAFLRVALPAIAAEVAGTLVEGRTGAAQ